MKKQIKKLTLYASIIILSISGVKIKSAKEKSKLFNIKIEEYDHHFDKGSFKIIAHRGFSSLAVENSKEAISLAEEKDYIDGIEMDLRLTKDKNLVLAHADFLTIDNLESIQVSNSSLKQLQETPLYHISNSLFYQLQNLFNEVEGTITIDRQNRLENKEYRLISLKEGLSLVKDKQIFLDLKFQDNFEDFSKSLEQELKGKPLENIVFQSEDFLSLLKLKKRYPSYQCSALIKCEEHLKFSHCFDQLGIKKTLISRKEVKKQIRDRKKISVWTINQIDDINNIVKELGKDATSIAYITDYPDMIGMYLEDKFTNKKEKQKKK